MYSLIIGIGIMVFLVVVWVTVQSVWGNVFAEHLTDEDVLAGRGGCHNCGCTTVCQNKMKSITSE